MARIRDGLSTKLEAGGGDAQELVQSYLGDCIPLQTMNGSEQAFNLNSMEYLGLEDKATVVKGCDLEALERFLGRATMML